MPEITPLGWFHTAIGITALVSGFLLRLSVGDPFVTSIEDPILKMSYLVLLVLFLLGLSLQFVWMRRQ